MINALVRSRGRLLVLLALAAVLLVGAIPTPPARAAEPDPDWLAVAIQADFSVSPWRVIYTVYAGKNNLVTNTATILKWKHIDVTGTCAVDGNLGAPDANGYVVFDGATRIKCDTPGIAIIWAELYPNKPALPATLTCPCRDGTPTDDFAPLFGSADARLVAGTFQNPVIAAPALGMSLSLPRNGNLARSRIDFDLLNDYVNSSSWSPKNAGNQLLLGGLNGPGIIAADAQFGWLQYLNTPWRPVFQPILGSELRHWYQAPNNWSNVAPVPSSYQLFTGAHEVYIGYNPDTGQYFNGAIRKGIIDPGCPSS